MEATNLVKHFTAFTRAETRLLPPLHKFEVRTRVPPFVGVDDETYAVTSCVRRAHHNSPFPRGWQPVLTMTRLIRTR
jgi:hypothetical protein